MKVEPISVSGSYEYLNEFGLKRWKKISIGATITEEDNVFCQLVMEQVSKIAALKNKERSKPVKQLVKYKSVTLSKENFNYKRPT